MREADVIAATREWIEKAVIGLNLCPFAEPVYVKEQVRFVVSTAKHLDGLWKTSTASWIFWPRRTPRPSTLHC